MSILRVGITGLGFLLAVLAYRLLSKLFHEQGPIPHRRYTAVFIFMLFSLALCGIGLVPNLLGAPGKSSATPVDDPGFWKAVYDKMPPSFIKRYSPGEEHVHVIHNKALVMFQGEPGTPGIVDEEFEKVILADHKLADQIAYNRTHSVQIEFTDPGSGFSPRRILTRKVRVDYGEEQYIVGLYLPAYFSGDESQAEIRAKAVGGLGVIQLLPPIAEDESIPVRIGQAIRDVAKEEGINPSDETPTAPRTPSE